MVGAGGGGKNAVSLEWVRAENSIPKRKGGY